MKNFFITSGPGRKKGSQKIISHCKAWQKIYKVYSVPLSMFIESLRLRRHLSDKLNDTLQLDGILCKRGEMNVRISV